METHNHYQSACAIRVRFPQILESEFLRTVTFLSFAEFQDHLPFPLWDMQCSPVLQGCSHCRSDTPLTLVHIFTVEDRISLWRFLFLLQLELVQAVSICFLPFSVEAFCFPDHMSTWPFHFSLFSHSHAFFQAAAKLRISSLSKCICFTCSLHLKSTYSSIFVNTLQNN